MSTVADRSSATSASLRSNSLSLTETISQSVANMAPTITPAINITVVAQLAGVGAWASFFIATIAILFVGLNISSLAKRHTVAGSFFLYIGRNMGPFVGVLSGWAMIAAYVVNSICVVVGGYIFASNMMTGLGLQSYMPPQWLFDTIFTLLVGYLVYRDVRLSSRISLVLEGVSILIIGAITWRLVSHHPGGVFATQQLNFHALKLAPIMLGLSFATFAFAGFESSATLAKETRNPKRNIPFAILFSSSLAGVLFTLVAYFMTLAVNDNSSIIGNSSSPFAEMTQRAGLSWAAAVVYFAALISSLGCNLANFNAAARIIFSMSRYQYIHRSLQYVHQTHQTPAGAILFCTIAVCVGCTLLLNLAPVDAFGYAGTFAVFGFVLIYFLVCIAAPLDMKRFARLRFRNLLVSAVGAILMLGVFVGSIYPLPPYPYNLIPYVFLGYMLIGAVWFSILKRRNANALSAIEHDLES